ncbi:MAG: hypothetical protein QOI26_1219 [Pseudonocardiales bacterium]|jgi:hypothetical protein|nr:hypothetical protein [Pseudonocardiales bacterium]MDT4993753.1 hypothetical protein [Actinoplanes sp.]
MTALGPEWRKSGRSDSNGNCVELRDKHGRVEMRDSKDPTGPILGFSHDAFADFIGDMKAGRFVSYGSSLAISSGTAAAAAGPNAASTRIGGNPGSHESGSAARTSRAAATGA